MRSGSNNWRTTPNENALSSSEPRAPSTNIPSRCPSALASAINEVLPIPGGPSIAKSRPRPDASPISDLITASSASRSSSPPCMASGLALSPALRVS